MPSTQRARSRGRWRKAPWRLKYEAAAKEDNDRAVTELRARHFGLETDSRGRLVLFEYMRQHDAGRYLA